MLHFSLDATASLPMMLGPKAQAVSYFVPTKYLFLPYSQAQSPEIPYFDYFWLSKVFCLPPACGFDFPFYLTDF